MKYVIINVYDREIVKVGIAETPSEATEIMKRDFMNVFLEHYDADDFENDNWRADEWDISETEAWLNGRMNYDWRIIEIE